ncbi:pentapeptide repeat-containing protein [Phytomonospora endophytica]|uniref:Pentapeptide repeat-containing protein n=1 Tax=Phytomonospora endophytica TaxID=714109 RepID=A0A841FRD1_9ACTN|nr:pentapeptide repeat-containing protein [Phytomonospora endophytica]MBB6036338.1 hypothetical protein [Phytomonospora endophytica]GIG67245.1 hypothetical protein Pen01_35400 [Phytomonospora endophytica]
MANDERKALGGTGPDGRRTVRPLRWWAAALGLLAVVAAATGAYFLLGAASEGVASPDAAATLRVEVLRTALSVGAGTGAAVALLLAWRRQWLLEHVAHDTSYDAAEKRVTELYVKAVEQLGSDKAPVRMGGLYALERLAQDNPPQRQMIVEVICAYLRMPFDPDDAGAYAHEERLVRRTAQRVLIRHTHPRRSNGEPHDGYWPGMSLDLSGAALVDFRLRRAVVASVDFVGATFHQRADFSATRFTEGAWFRSATFRGPTFFTGASFAETADFGGCVLPGDADFTGVSVADPGKAVDLPIRP